MLQYVDIQSFLVFLVVFLLAYLYWTTRLPDNFPPGPCRVPIFGNMITFGRNPGRAHLVVQDLIKQYGPVVGLKFGSYPTIILSDLEIIKEAFVKQADVFSNRPSWMFFMKKINFINGRIHGLIMQNGQRWRDIRRFTLMSLRDFGVGKQSIEEKIQEEGDTLCKELRKFGNQPIDIVTLLQVAVSNIICSICFGTRFEYDDPEFINMMKMLNDNFSSELLSSPANFIPLLQLTPGQGGLQEAIKKTHKIKAFIGKKINEHRQSFNPSEVRDFVDLYLTCELKGGEETSFNTHDIESVILSLFAAGTETTSTTLRWILLYMMYNPDVQKKCQQELDRVIGSNRRPRLSDRANMPYTMAVIQEMQRLGNVAPLGIPHSVRETTTLFGYTIPKNTIVLSSLYSVHMDPKYWSNPELFKPERWIGPDGKLEKKEAFIPFSAGPRMCLGDMLAKNELFLFFTRLMQKFTFNIADPENPPSLEGYMGATRAPLPFKALIQQR